MVVVGSVSLAFCGIYRINRANSVEAQQTVDKVKDLTSHVPGGRLCVGPQCQLDDMPGFPGG